MGNKGKTFKERKRRARAMARELKKIYGKKTQTALHYKSPWQLLVATILSAQCTDERVNRITKELFKKYPDVKDYASMRKDTLEKQIHSCGFYKNKAKNIKKAAKMIVDEYSGKVPGTMEELVKLPGVARKTANVVLGDAFGKTEGIAVDTHVRRFARKFDLTDEKNPEKIEKDLMKLLPESTWRRFSHQLIYYGREYCGARKHECREHPLTKLHPKAAHNWPKAS